MYGERDKAFGARIVAWRKKYHISQNKLAGRLGITRQRLWSWETAGVPVHDLVIVELALKTLAAP